MFYSWLLVAVCVGLAAQNVRAQCGNPPGPCCIVAGSILYTVDHTCTRNDHCVCEDYKEIFSDDGEIGRCMFPPYDCIKVDDDSTPETYMNTEETVRYVYKHIVLAMVVRECFASLGEDNECCCNLSAYVYSNIRREGKQIDLPWN